jgi:protein-S-isoprenylcysteine O-methyltransferase Ste14
VENFYNNRPVVKQLKWMLSPNGENSMFLRWLCAILLLPVMVLAVIPATMLYFSSYHWQPLDPWIAAVAIPLMAVGLLLAFATTRLFHRKGKGTAAPWDPPTVLVIEGPYRHVRNPMIAGVFAMLVAEALIFNSPYLWAWFLLFFLGKTVYIPLFEEKWLEKTFGQKYTTYKNNVPRWIPRLTPWTE